MRIGVTLGAAILLNFPFANLSQAQGLPDTDIDRIPDVWETQYGLNASAENFRVGSSVDGNLIVNAGQTTYLNDTAIVVSSTQIAGSSELTGVIPITTRIGDVFMLHVTQNGNPTSGAQIGRAHV